MIRTLSISPGPASGATGALTEPMAEDVCAENNQHLFDYHIPVADKPDF